MHVIRTIARLRESLAKTEPATGRRVSLVPTMGALHAGHLALVERARAESDVVVASIFVNPTQFNNAADLTSYPRHEAEDVALLAAVGVDVAFMPSVTEMYPDQSATTVRVGGIAELLEGETRGPSHFEGVATVVAKLFNIVQPHVAYFGRKDAQQLLVVRQMARDLNLPVEIVGCETVREPDGLALSSRNARLNGAERQQARALSAALFHMRDAFDGGEHRAARLLEHGHGVLLAHGIDASRVDYLAVVNPHTLQPLAVVESGAMLAVAAHVGAVRLIDNVEVRMSGVGDEFRDGTNHQLQDRMSGTNSA